MFYDGCATVPLANWMNRKHEAGWDKRARITTKKEILQIERVPPRLAMRCGKGWGASPGWKKKRVGKLVEREMRVKLKLP